MAFKTMREHNEEKFGGLFLLRNDGDYADVVFLYQNVDDVLIADTHYIKSPEYNGYVHCCGRGCPACSKGIRVQTKLFIPMLNITDNEIQFWDRSTRFENQLMSDVFSKYPNPSEFVFRITRNGAAGSVDTTYTIMAVGRNSTKTFGQILAEHNKTFPDAYEQVCRDVPAGMLYNMLNATAPAAPEPAEMPNYQVTPRRSSVASPVIPASQVVNVPASTDVPGEYAPAVNTEYAGVQYPEYATPVADNTAPFDLSDDSLSIDGEPVF